MKPLRRVLMLPALAAAALVLASCGASGGAADASGGTGGVDLVRAGALTVCTNPPFEPFVYEKNGEIVGIDMDIVGEVAQDLGVELSLKSTPFEGIHSGADLQTGNCDITASAITITPERQAKFDFSDPYFDADQALLVPEGSPLTDLASLAGKRVGVKLATTGEAWAEAQGLSTVQFEDLGLQIQALKTGQVDAVVSDIGVLVPYENDEFTIAATFPTGEKYGLGVKKGNTGLLDVVNTTLERIASDGTYDAIMDDRLGSSSSSAR